HLLSPASRALLTHTVTVAVDKPRATRCSSRTHAPRTLVGQRPLQGGTRQHRSGLKESQEVASGGLYCVGTDLRRYTRRQNHRRYRDEPSLHPFEIVEEGAKKDDARPVRRSAQLQEAKGWQDLDALRQRSRIDAAELALNEGFDTLQRLLNQLLSRLVRPTTVVHIIDALF